MSKSLLEEKGIYHSERKACEKVDRCGMFGAECRSAEQDCEELGLLPSNCPVSEPLLADLPWLLPEINHFSLLHPMPLCISIKTLAAKATTPMKTFNTISLLSCVPAPSHYPYKLFERRVSLVPCTAHHHTE